MVVVGQLPSGLGVRLAFGVWRFVLVLPTSPAWKEKGRNLLWLRRTGCARKRLLAG
jgi:hypothetical protein